MCRQYSAFFTNVNICLYYHIVGCRRYFSLFLFLFFILFLLFLCVLLFDCFLLSDFPIMKEAFFFLVFNILEAVSVALQELADLLVQLFMILFRGF